MNQNLQMYRSLFFIAISGNIIFVLWVLLNGINEGFSGTPPEIVSYIGLMLLLTLNTFLLFKYQKK
jgi:hypothetical protein